MHLPDEFWVEPVQEEGQPAGGQVDAFPEADYLGRLRIWSVQPETFLSEETLIDLRGHIMARVIQHDLEALRRLANDLTFIAWALDSRSAGLLKQAIETQCLAADVRCALHILENPC